MADDAIVSLSALVLPDEIAKGGEPKFASQVPLSPLSSCDTEKK